MKLTQREHVYQQIRRKLAVGAIAAGARLSPTVLAKELGVSSTPVREALSQLQTEGLAVHTPHRGVFVRQSDREELVELIEMRTIMECHAAAQAARRISSDQLRELDDAWDGMMCRIVEGCNIIPGTDPREFLQAWNVADMVFHLVLARASGNRQLLRTIDDLRIMTRMFGHRNDPPSVWANPAVFYQRNEQIHKDIYEAVRRHDAKAARRAMAVHMRASRKTLLRRLDWLRRQNNCDDSLAMDFPESMQDTIRDVEQHGLSDPLPNSYRLPDGVRPEEN